MQWRFQRLGAATFALLFSVVPLRADITLPTAAPSPPPQADALTVRILRGERTLIPLRGHHSGSGSVTFWIVDPPTHGTLVELRVLGDNRATVVYQNDGAEPATDDRFTYLVRTSANRASSPAEVRITVDEPPPRLQVPGQIEFEQIVAGQSQTRDLKITNEGGGVLEGRLTVSAPWRLATSEYRVASGKTARIAVSFRPGEGRDFVGQITLTGSDGALSSVLLKGSATSPIALEPAQLRIARPEDMDAPRTASISLTNRTDRPLTLKFSSDRKIRPIADITLAPAEEKAIPVVIAAEAAVPVDETIVVRGEGFSARLPVVAEALPAPSASPSSSPTPASVAGASPRAVAKPGGPVVARPNVVRPDPAPPPATSVPSGLRLVPVRAQRLEGEGWELRWARPKETVAHYRIEERFLSLDEKGALQTAWRASPPPKIAIVGDAVMAPISGLDPRQVHSLKVTALGADGTMLWESPLVVLGPPAEPSHRTRTWTLLLGLALLALVALRWRANHSSA